MNLKNEILDMRKAIILILIAIFSLWGLNNLEMIIGVIKTIYNVLQPFILGGVIAYILNIPMTKIEKLLTKKIKTKNNIVRIISIVLSLLLFLAIIIFILFLLMPELIENIKMLINNIPGIIDKIEIVILDLLDKYPDVQTEIKELFSSTGNISDIVSNLLNYFVNGAIDFIGNLVSGFITFFTAIIFSIYMLSQKEYLIRGYKKLVYAYTNKKRADKLMEIGTMANKTFNNFISGQCVEAVILGCIIFVASTLFRFPYALIISVLTTVTALIPIFGAMFAMIVGAILIGINNPIQAVIFIIVFQIVQQIEGNLIYPKVVGKSVGLSPIWTLMAITVGGKLLGIVGMVIGLPVASVAHTIIKEEAKDRLKEKNIKIV